MTLPKGVYRTANGSEMRISGKHGGISEVEFDWLEEDGCLDCEPAAYDDDGYLIWHCDECGGGRAKLNKEFESELAGQQLDALLREIYCQIDRQCMNSLDIIDADVRLARRSIGQRFRRGSHA